jgi:DNA helicase-2/ATP-dependent DNA helicase PcrA
MQKQDEHQSSKQTSPSNLLQGLNDEQRNAVALPSEHALILAGAGSGKTRVLTTRIAWLLQTGQVSPAGILGVTFTNKAAKEMLTRLSAMLPLQTRTMWIGTFHGLCNRFLRAHWKLANLPQAFQILDTQDQLSSIKRLYKEFKIDEERYPAKQSMWFIAGSKEEGQRPDDVPVKDSDTRKLVEIYHLYEAQCQREGVVDFAELMLRSYELLRDNELLREHYQSRFKHLLIDEFQDTNKLQYAWLKMLCGSYSSIFAVGDDDQSIYAFRGARVGNMSDFVSQFKVKHQIKLEQNYRSNSNILDSANHLISHNKNRLGKNLRTDQGAGEPVRLIETSTDLLESLWIVEEIKHLLNESADTKGVGYVTHKSEIAILYRSNAQSRVIETALFNNAIPYRVYGGLRFFERAEIKNALAYLRLIENPRDDTSFLRVVNFPARGIGARTLEHLSDIAKDKGLSMFEAVPLMSGKAGLNLSAFTSLIDDIKVQSINCTLKEIVELVLEQTKMVEHYKAEREGADRVENLLELINAAQSFVMLEGFGRDALANGPLGGKPSIKTHEQSDFVEKLTIDAAQKIEETIETGETQSPLIAFLTHASLEAGDNQAQAGQEAVQMMTVHAAKGLEFDCVFISGLEEGLFPHENSMNDHNGLEEERRLMYVAITRARKRLYLSHSQTRMLHGQTRYNIRSRFIDELPSHALKALTPPKSATALPTWGAWAQADMDIREGTGSSRKNYSPFLDKSHNKRASLSAPDSLVVQRPDEGPNSWVKVGVKVFHNKFGEGEVLTIEGRGEDARAQVSFTRHGIKWLALSVAKLTPC